MSEQVRAHKYPCDDKSCPQFLCIQSWDRPVPVAVRLYGRSPLIEYTLPAAKIIVEAQRASFVEIGHE